MAAVAKSAPAMEEALYDTAPMRRLAQLGGNDAIPDEMTIGNYRRLLETHQLAAQLFSQVNANLSSKGLRLVGGKPPLRHHLQWEKHLDRRIFHVFCESSVSNQ